MDELHKFLSQRTMENSGSKFEKEIAAHFFKEIGLNPRRDSISIDQFIESFGKLETQLIDRINDAQSEIQSCDDEQKKHLHNAKAAVAEDRNLRGMSKNSVLTVEILKGLSFIHNKYNLKVKCSIGN